MRVVSKGRLEKPHGGVDYLELRSELGLIVTQVTWRFHAKKVMNEGPFKRGVEEH